MSKFPMSCPVIVDGNRHHFGKPIQTILSENISIRKCKNMLENLREEYPLEEISEIAKEMYWPILLEWIKNNKDNILSRIS